MKNDLIFTKNEQIIVQIFTKKYENYSKKKVYFIQIYSNLILKKAI